MLILKILNYHNKYCSRLLAKCQWEKFCWV